MSADKVIEIEYDPEKRGKEITWYENITWQQGGKVDWSDNEDTVMYLNCHEPRWILVQHGYNKGSCFAVYEDGSMVEIGAKYKHYKGGIYTVVHIGLHTDDKSPVVIYKDDENQIWVRPLKEWYNVVDGDTRRFERIYDKTEIYNETK